MKSLVVIPPGGKSDTVSVLKKAPSLRTGNDAKIAAELEAFIAEAERAVVTIVKVGFFIECIADQLPHGQLGPWLAAYCPGRSLRTVRRWKEVAANVGEAVGISYKARVNLKLHEILSLPMDQVPAGALKVRQQIDDLITGKSYRQLAFDFKQCDADGKPKRGNLSGKGCTKEHRAAAQTAEDEARLNELTLSAEDHIKWILANADHKHFGQLPTALLTQLTHAWATGLAYARPVIEARKQAATRTNV